MKPNIRSLNYGTLYSLTITKLPIEPYSIDFNSPSFKILIDYYMEENPTSSQEFINRTMDML